MRSTTGGNGLHSRMKLPDGHHADIYVWRMGRNYLARIVTDRGEISQPSTNTREGRKARTLRDALQNAKKTAIGMYTVIGSSRS